MKNKTKQKHKQPCKKQSKRNNTNKKNKLDVIIQFQEKTKLRKTIKRKLLQKLKKQMNEQQ